MNFVDKTKRYNLMLLFDELLYFTTSFRADQVASFIGAIQIRIWRRNLNDSTALAMNVNDLLTKRVELNFLKKDQLERIGMN